jgi:predicted ATPase
MIQKIISTRNNLCIKTGFELNLKKLTLITGENNVGKTTFIKQINQKKNVKFYDKDDNEINDIEILYFPAESISPAETELKSSNQSSNFLSNLSKLFENLEIEFKLENKTQIDETLNSFTEKITSNLKLFNGDDKFKIKFNLGSELKSNVILQSIIEKIIFEEGESARTLKNIGQGIQRLIIVSTLKSYLDILKEQSNFNKKILILFEEPEIFLHPKLKRILNNILEEISKEDNHQIIITTHDPYFASKNMEDTEDKVIYSFFKENDVTKCSEKNIICGIEDELLYSWLYNLIEKNGKKKELKDIKILDKERKYCKNGNCNIDNLDDFTYIRHQIHHLGDNPNTVGLTEKTDLVDKNYYSENELRKGINEMCKIIGNN